MECKTFRKWNRLPYDVVRPKLRLFIKPGWLVVRDADKNNSRAG